MTSLWLRVPVMVRAIATGLAMGAAGTVPWAMLVAANMRYASFLPWAVPIMAAYLWLFWRYAIGTLTIWAFAGLAGASRSARVP